MPTDHPSALPLTWPPRDYAYPVEGGKGVCVVFVEGLVLSYRSLVGWLPHTGTTMISTAIINTLASTQHQYTEELALVKDEFQAALSYECQNIELSGH